jgi:membrane-bound lytic murein transglycosylase D
MQVAGNQIRIITVIAAMAGLFACSSITEPWSQEESSKLLTSVELDKDEPLEQSLTDSAIRTEETANPIEPITMVAFANEPSDLWQRIRQGYLLDINNLPPSVIRQRDWYIENPQYLNIVIDRARPFIHYVAEQIEKANLPMELVLLPIVESTYDPYAYSPSHAAGLWQFIPSTAKQFGLERSRWYDGRRDVVASTGAAIAFLKYLYTRFDGNWLHALAAYNSGEGNVRKAIRNNERAGKPTTFWNLDLPRETRNYVPQLLALTSLIENPENFSILLPELADKPFFSVIQVDHQISLNKVAELTAVNKNIFSQLNAAYRRSLTPPEKTSRLLLPIDNAAILQNFIATTDPKLWMPYTEYIVVAGDTLSQLAFKFDTKVSAISRANKLPNSRLKIGQMLLIPLEDNIDNLMGEVRYTVIQHRVEAGDTLSELAQTYGTSVKELRRQNSFTNNVIRVGDLIDVTTTTTAGEKPRKLSYRVKRGDSLYIIAKRFSLSISDIAKWNRLNSKKYLQPGQLLTLFIDRKII